MEEDILRLSQKEMQVVTELEHLGIEREKAIEIVTRNRMTILRPYRPKELAERLRDIEKTRKEEGIKSILKKKKSRR